MSANEWTPNQSNMVMFVLTDNSQTELTGLGANFTVKLSKAGAAFITGQGTKAEVGLGVYRYISTAGEADTQGPLFIVVTAVGAQQQNLEYVVGSRVILAQPFTYTLRNSLTNDPIEGATIWVTTDSAGAHIVWTGKTDSSGVARDIYSNLPLLEPGTYYFFAAKSGFIFNNPDVEQVS